MSTSIKMQKIFAGSGKRVGDYPLKAAMQKYYGYPVDLKIGAEELSVFKAWVAAGIDGAADIVEALCSLGEGEHLEIEESE
jgi:hypothetical protein